MDMIILPIFFCLLLGAHSAAMGFSKTAKHYMWSCWISGWLFATAVCSISFAFILGN